MHKSAGIVGAGLMGQGIAYNLVTKGYPVSKLDHAGNQPLAELTAGGAMV